MDNNYLMKVDDFDTNFVSLISLLRDSEELFDVTLVSDDEIPIQAHKVILSASSPFFRSVIKLSTVHPSPLLYIRGAKNTVLRNVVDFLYKGEVTVAESDLDNFLKLSKDLKLKGLCEDDQDSSEDGSTEESLKILEESKKETKKMMAKKDEIDKNSRKDNLTESELINIENTQEVKLEKYEIKIKDASDVSELNAKILEMMERRDRVWYCTVCGISKPKKCNVQTHIEINHLDAPQPCNFCDVVSKNRPALSLHMKKNHSTQ